MLGYVTIGTNDFERAKTYFDALFAEMGGKRTFANDHMQGYGSRAGAMVMVCTPNDGNAATVGNGTMLALAAPTQEIVDKVYAKAMALGSKDEGAPGDRGNGFYGAYFRDLDGNKFCAFKMG
jgi:predicted lactoylglutathione lyase